MRAMEWRTLHAPVFVTFVHFSLLGVKQSLLPHILSTAFEPGALARVLGQLALITSLSACVCMPVMAAVAGRGRARGAALAAVLIDVVVEACYAARGVASSLRALRALAVFHGASVVVVPLAQAAMVARRDGEGKEEGKFDTGRGALLASRYAVLGGAMSLGGVAGATCGSLVYHRVSPAAPFVAGAVASAVVMNGLDPDDFNAKTDMKTAFRKTIASIIQSDEICPGGAADYETCIGEPVATLARGCGPALDRAHGGRVGAPRAVVAALHDDDRFCSGDRAERRDQNSTACGLLPIHCPARAAHLEAR
mgnify:CR=1 FL=1